MCFAGLRFGGSPHFGEDFSRSDNLLVNYCDPEIGISLGKIGDVLIGPIVIFPIFRRRWGTGG